MNCAKLKAKTSTIAIYVIALMLVGLGYWNYISVESQNIETVAETQNEINNDDENLGDAQLVNSNEVITNSEDSEKEEDSNENNSQSTEVESESYFEESKLQRDTMYSQTLETYKEMLNNSNVSEEQKSIITQEISDLNKEKNAIMVCENLIATKGFENCVIFVNTNSISVVIGCEELKQDEIAQIQNIISREMDAEVENIHIMTKNV